MDCTLGAELRDAGFPQPVKSGKDFIERTGNGQWDYLQAGKSMTRAVYAPTLEELIEACGDKLRFIAESGNFPQLTIINIPWVAFAYGVECGGHTPTEAVARLWLALNKK